MEFQRPVIVDDAAIWKPAEDTRTLYERAHNPRERLPERHQLTRRKAGVSTFGTGGRVALTVGLVLPMVFAWLIMASAWGPVWATCFTLGMSGFWLVAARFVLPDVWRKEPAFSDPMPLRESLREYQASRRRDRDDRAGLVGGRYRCAACGSARRPGEQRCYRCGGAGWVERFGPGGFFACGSCDEPLDVDEPRQWCQSCGAARSIAVYVQPTGDDTRSAAAAREFVSARPIDPYRDFGTGSKIAWTLPIVICGLVLVAFRGAEAPWAWPGFAVVAVILLWAIWRR